MAEKEASKILIEPSDKVVETLRLAVLDVGLDELIRRTGSSPDLVEKWINGEDWVPLDAVKEACAINRDRQDAPSHSKILSECTAGAKFRITAREEVEKPAAPVVGEVAPAKAEISAEGLKKPSAIAVRAGVSRQIARLAIALFIVPLLGAVVGFLMAGPLGAVTGTILSFAIVTAFAFLLLLPRKMREA